MVGGGARLARARWPRPTPAEQTAWIAAFVEEDRARGFRFDEASLARFMLVRCGEARYEFIWTNHHLMLDGWSGSIVRQAAFDCYEALCRGEQPVLAPPRPFSDFVAWQHEQDMSGAEDYWRRRLSGMRGPTRLGVVVGTGMGY